MKESLQISARKSFVASSELYRWRASSRLRLFAGFYEGEPRLIADVFASTLLLTVYCEITAEARSLLTMAQDFYLGRLPWLSCVLQKQRLAKDLSLKRGQITFGSQPAERILENGLYHAIDLTLNQDASFYLDTRGLRDWLRDTATGWMF